MDDLDSLRRELAREKATTQSKREIQDIGVERKKLKSQIKSERFNRNYGGYVSGAKSFGSTVGGFMSGLSGNYNRNMKKKTKGNGVTDGWGF